MFMFGGTGGSHIKVGVYTASTPTQGFLPKPLYGRIENHCFTGDPPMARPKSLAKMSIEALIDLRDSITATLSAQAAELQKQLSRLTGTGDSGANGARRGRKPGRPRGSALKGRKVPAKYRSRKDPKLTWAGRGATPRWMRDEMKAGKLKKEAFLIK
jgi:DNA-binding protein H-NS